MAEDRALTCTAYDNVGMAAQPITETDRALARALAETFEDRAMSKAELARRSGFAVNSITKYLEGTSAMTLGTYWALMAALRVSRKEATSKVAGVLAADNPQE